jgi:monovalent cation:H+ antiporter, CPA1 family
VAIADLEINSMEAHEVIGLLLPLAAICSYINYKFVKLPKAIGVTLIALVITLLVNISGLFGWQADNFAQNLVDNIGFNETFLHGMLSFLIFAGALHINTKEMAKDKFLIAIFATLSVLISTLVIGYSTYLITSLLNINLPFYYCFVFGALISPTDAIAVIGILKSAKIPKNIEMKIAGEALFNDGMGIVLFILALALADGEVKALDTKHAFVYFIREAGGGFVFGALLGWLSAQVLKTIDDYELAILLTLSIVTGGYAFAVSILDVSGAICMAMAGIMIGSKLKNSKMSNESIVRVEVFWDLIDQLLNTILFVLIGLEFMRIDFDMTISLAAIGIILATLFARWLSIILPVTLLASFNKLNSSVITLMTWSGLRGGISIALALSVSGKYHDLLVTITYFVVLFSIFVQGLTIKPLVQKISRSKAFN